MKEYGTHFVEWHPAPPGDGSMPALHEILNKWAKAGWTLFDVKPMPIGFLAIFERELPRKEEEKRVAL